MKRVLLWEFEISFSTDEDWERAFHCDDSEYDMPVLIAVSSESDWEKAWDTSNAGFDDFPNGDLSRRSKLTRPTFLQNRKLHLLSSRYMIRPSSRNGSMMYWQAHRATRASSQSDSNWRVLIWNPRKMFAI
eukprot:GILJ01039458.1.p1 GENE.GILJ01039458.1~~GILJ01039458.1.p1  ORF type:complete len:131 (-),score=6.86 GILJ01039458.1:352-744(-)